MNIPLVDLKAQYLTIKNEIDQAVLHCISEGRFIGGEPVREFEKKFADFCKAGYCASCGNCTDALEIALRVLGIGEGDEVIVPAMSFIATSEAVTNSGASVVFCDIDPDSYTINTDLIPSLITEKTRAIIPVHLYGQMANMPAIRSIADQYNLKVIEDAAQAHGATYGGKPAGYYSDFAAFSFYPGKNLGAYGDAGALITNIEELAVRARMYANHGRISKYDHEFEGKNSRMDTLQACVLNVKLNYLAEWIDKRRAIAGHYESRLASNHEIITPKIHPEIKHVFHLYVIRVASEARDPLCRQLNGHGISTGIHYPVPLPFLKSYKDLKHAFEDFPVAHMYSSQIISLPIYPELDLAEVDYICDTVCNFFLTDS